MRRASKALPRSFPVRLPPRILGSLLSHRCAVDATGSLPACPFRNLQGLGETGSLGYTMAARGARAGVADDGTAPKRSHAVLWRPATDTSLVEGAGDRTRRRCRAAEEVTAGGAGGPREFCSRGRRAAGAFEARASAEGPRRSLSEHRMPDPAGRLRSV